MHTTTGKGTPCQGITKDGRPCASWAVHGSGLCFWHNPALADERKAARIRGGKARHNRTIGQAGGAAWVEIATVADVVRVLGQELNEVLRLERSLQRARTVGYLGGVLVKALEVSDVETRLQALEAAAGIGGDK